MSVSKQPSYFGHNAPAILVAAPPRRVYRRLNMNSCLLRVSTAEPTLSRQALSPTIHPAPCRARSAHTKLNVSLLGEVANAEMLQARIRRISYGPALSPLRPIL